MKVLKGYVQTCENNESIEDIDGTLSVSAYIVNLKEKHAKLNRGNGQCQVLNM